MFLNCAKLWLLFGTGAQKGKNMAVKIVELTFSSRAKMYNRVKSSETVGKIVESL